MKPHIVDAFQNGKFVLPLQVEGASRDQMRAIFVGAVVQAFGLPAQHSLREAWLFRFTLSTGWIVDFSSACTGTGNWQEVGSLNIDFARDRHSNDGISWVTTPAVNFQVKTVECLIYEEVNVYAECGIVLTDFHGREIIIAAAPAPGSVSVAAPFSTDLFRPEFAADQYQRQPLQGLNVPDGRPPSIG